MKPTLIKVSGREPTGEQGYEVASERGCRTGCAAGLLVYQARPISLAHWKLCSQYAQLQLPVSERNGSGLIDYRSVCTSQATVLVWHTSLSLPQALVLHDTSCVENGARQMSSPIH